jgi:hypothetical protein
MQTVICLDPNNVFDNFDGRLVLEGYVRRHNLSPEQPWDDSDVMVWSSLKRVYEKQYKIGCKWMISQIIQGHKVTDVIRAAGPWWIERQSKHCPLLVLDVV